MFVNYSYPASDYVSRTIDYRLTYVENDLEEIFPECIAQIIGEYDFVDESDFE